MIEQRKFIRVPEDSPISYEVLDSKKTGNAVTRDISQGGIRFFANEFISPKSILRMKLGIQSLRKKSFNMEAIAKVVWVVKEGGSNNYEIGAKFTRVSMLAKRNFGNYIKSVLKIK